MAFHWRNGWYFSRLPDGSVEVRNHGDFDKHDPSPAPGDGRTTLVIPANEWASIVCLVSEAGESGGRWDEALEFHTGLAANTKHVYVARGKHGGGYAYIHHIDTGFGKPIRSTDNPMAALQGDGSCFPACLMDVLGGHASGFEAVQLTIRSRLGAVKELPDPSTYFDD